MDNVFDNFDSDTEEENNDHIFLNMEKSSEYLKSRNELFTPDIIKKNIVIDSHNIDQNDSDFNSSDFIVHFENTSENENKVYTNNYDIYNNVIDFKLIKASIRVPPYNINKTNNIIKYKTASSDKIHTITIQPGQYTMNDIVNVFTKYKTLISDVEIKYSQYITYSDDRVQKTSPTHTFTLELLKRNSKDITIPDDLKGSPLDLVFKFKYDTTVGDGFTFLWDYDNITRGAAMIFGFSPENYKSIYNLNSTPNQYEAYSNKIIDISSHYVDIVIPEIPNIACKKNSAGLDIIERIQLKAPHGEYLHYRTYYERNHNSYFHPIKLHQLHLKLFSQNNELYDTNNSEVSYEFEITMLKNKNKLR